MKFGASATKEAGSYSTSEWLSKKPFIDPCALVNLRSPRSLNLLAIIYVKGFLTLAGDKTIVSFFTAYQVNYETISDSQFIVE